MKRRNFIKQSVMAATGSALLGTGLFAAAETSKDSKTMKITVLTGSPRRKGNSNFLADNFVKGAEEAGHSVFRFDCAVHKFGGCLGCNACGMNGECVQKDDFELVRPHLIEADMVVFVSPMYYFNVSEQLKCAIDRFYAINGTIKGAHKKAMFMVTYAGNSADDEEPLRVYFKKLCSYMSWENAGVLFATNCWNAGDVKQTDFGQKAYQMGKAL